VVEGALKRVAVEPPAIDPELLEEFRGFVDGWLEEHLKPLDPGTDTSFSTWRDTRTTYPKWRKDELTRLYDIIGDGWLDSYADVNSFIKAEQYSEYKYPRWINARCDEAKIHFGPWVSQIEKVLYELPEFIKHVPVSERAAYCTEKLGGRRYYFSGDFSSYEASHVQEFMLASEFQLYRHMVRHVPGGIDFYCRFKEVCAGYNILRHKLCTLYVKAKRQSGEVSTSCGNSFGTLMLYKFIAHKSKVDIDIEVEGDDALGGCDSKELDISLFSKLGFTVKFDWFDELSEASFCGLIFDPQDKINITDPIKVLATFGWTDGKYALVKKSKRNALLRAKALSLAYSYPSCPIIQALARYALRVTSGHDAKYALNNRSMSEWDRDWMNKVLSVPEKQLRELVERPIPYRTRLLVEKKFGISAAAQVSAERYLDSLDQVQPLMLPELQQFVHADWIDFWDRFVRRVPSAKALNRGYY
jgi:hypothetical protein